MLHTQIKLLICFLKLLMVTNLHNCQKSIQLHYKKYFKLSKQI